MSDVAVPGASAPARRGSARRLYRLGEGLGERPTPPALAVLTVVAYTGVAVIRPGLPQNLAFIDPVLLALSAYSLLSMTYRGSPATSGALRLLPWFWLILLGSFLGLAAVGIPYWAVSNLSRTVFALLTFICFWHLVLVAGLQRLAVIGTAVGVAVTAVMLVAYPKYRGAAFFQHPNYAGHYMAMACFVLIALSRRWYAKVAAGLALLIAIQGTGSFGAMAMTLAMLAVVGFRFLTRNTAILAAALAVLAIGGLFLATPQAADLVPNDESGWYLTESISAQRFERSQDTRISLWSQALAAYAEEPLGIGPDGVRRREVAEWRGTKLEIHSDAIGYLVERGVIGLIGFIGLWTTLLVIAKKGGLARILIVGMLVQGLFRETMHYRHMWMLLALAFAWDHRNWLLGSDDDGDDPADAGEPAPAPGALGGER